MSDDDADAEVETEAAGEQQAEAFEAYPEGYDGSEGRSLGGRTAAEMAVGIAPDEGELDDPGSDIEQRKQGGGAGGGICFSLSLLVLLVALMSALHQWSEQQRRGGEHQYGQRRVRVAPVLPPADALSFGSAFMPIKEVFPHVATPSTWTEWHAGCSAVSGQIDQLAASGSRLRQSVAVGGRKERELQWTIQEVHNPQHSVDGDGLLYAEAHDREDDSFALGMRMLLWPLTKYRTNVTLAFYWRGREPMGPKAKRRIELHTNRTVELLLDRFKGE